jgi:hypothetical protein
LSQFFTKTFLGTKDLIECECLTYNCWCVSIDVPRAYIYEQEKALEYIRQTTELSNDEKKRFFKTANTNLGVSALCLSGGASFGYCKFADTVLVFSHFLLHTYAT